MCERLNSMCSSDYGDCGGQCEPSPPECTDDEKQKDDAGKDDEKQDENDTDRRQIPGGSGSGAGSGSGSGSGAGSGGGSGGGPGGGSGGAPGGGSGSGSGSGSGGGPGGGSGGGSGNDWSNGPPAIPGWPPAGGGGGGNNINICVGDGACSIADPHLTSFDGVHFDFQGAGEYHFARSNEHDIDVQVRYEPAHASQHVSVNTAVAARVGPNRVTVVAGRTPAIEVNGSPVAVGSGLANAVAHESGIIIDRFDHVYRINMSRGVVLKVGHYSYLNLEVVSTEHAVAGLGGSNDGDPGNDFTTRAGVTLSPGDAWLSYEQLYKQFGDSWRIEQEESLFDYADGESTATFTRLDFPKDLLDIATMDAAARKRAEEICREAGVKPGGAFRNCVYDVGFTGDAGYAAGYVKRKIGSIATLDAPDTVAAGSRIVVHWTGPANKNDFVTLAKPESRGDHSEAFSQLDGTGQVALPVPGVPGEYELRYVLDVDRQVIASRPLKVTAVTATLDAPAAVAAGSQIPVRWTGPANENDFVALAQPGSRGDHFLRFMHVSAETNTVEVRAPDEPGDYVLRYVLNNGRQVIAEIPLEVN
jgi:hypothetical protein